MQIPISIVARTLLGRSLLVQAAGAALAAGGAAYYFTHPQRVLVHLPEDLASRAESVTLAAADGAALHAWWIPGERQNGKSCDRTIVHHHGFNGCAGVLMARRALLGRRPLRLPMGNNGEGAQAGPLAAWPVVREGLGRGYNFLLVDARGHGRSEGPWDSSGVLQISDAMQWAMWLHREQTQLWAGLWGHSYGAAIGLALAVRSSGGGYDAMVLDSPVLLAKGVYEGVIRKSAPLIGEPIYAVIQPVIQRVGNKTLYPMLQAHRPRMPILLIHGMEDGHVPAWQSEEAYELMHDEADPDRTALWLVPGAAHLEGLEVAAAEYVGRTLDWFDRWM